MPDRRQHWSIGGAYCLLGFPDTGGTSLLDSYRDEFNAIIARESVGALLRKSPGRRRK
jgi:hypothetical protein